MDLSTKKALKVLNIFNYLICSILALKQLYSLFELIENGSLELLELTAGFIRKKKLTRHSASPKSPNRGLPISVVVINDFLAFKSLLFNSVLSRSFSLFP